MENRSELIVYCNKEKFRQGFFSTFFVVVALCLLLFLTRDSFLWTIPCIGMGLRVGLGLFLAILLVAFWYAICETKNERPFFIFSEDGVWIRNFGFVHWDEIDEVGTYPYIMGKECYRCFGLRFKDMRSISRRADWHGKMRLFWARLFKYPPVLMPNLDVPDDEILRFVGRYKSCENKFSLFNK